MSAINERVSPKRLAEIIARAEVCDDSVLTDYRDIESIARELQQYRAAADPIYQVRFSLGWRDVTKAQYDDHEAHGAPVRIVYAAPQVTSVPDVSDLEKVLRFIESLPVPTKGAGINGKRLYDFIVSCRAAMLTAAPAVQAEQLSGNTEQVEPVSDANKLGGWIPVSERMPEFNDEVLVWHRHGFPMLAVYGACKDPKTYKTYRCLRNNDGEIDATHWMPLPAAPKQEVKAAFEMGMSRYGDAMQKLADGGD